MQAEIIPFDPSNASTTTECAEFLRKGKLVAFPTETVYGLGANALDTNAVLSIFTAKGRPLTDPVIVHVLDAEQALQIIHPDIKSEKYLQLFSLLTSSFWPGPLTIVSRAANHVPACVTANTGFVGIRSPRHRAARALIGCPPQATQQPTDNYYTGPLYVAAPSANRFGHVSPTTAQHVFEDLGAHPIKILDDGPSCEIGIESTVVKIDTGSTTDFMLSVLRRGGVSIDQLQSCVASKPFSDHVSVAVTTVDNRVVPKAAEPTTQQQPEEQEQGEVAPGQLLTHYAPDVPAYIIGDHEIVHSTNSNSNNGGGIPLDRCVVIDFGGRLREQLLSREDGVRVLEYIDLSEQGIVNEATKTLFDKLRVSEKVDRAQAILLPNLLHKQSAHLEHADALFDRIFRAASGRYADLDLAAHVVRPSD